MAIVSDVLGGGSKGPACPTLGRRRLRAVTGVLRRVPPSRGRALALVLTRLSPLRPHPCPPLRHAERGNERAVVVPPLHLVERGTGVTARRGRRSRAARAVPHRGTCECRHSAVPRARRSGRTPRASLRRGGCRRGRRA